MRLRVALFGWVSRSDLLPVVVEKWSVGAGMVQLGPWTDIEFPEFTPEQAKAARANAISEAVAASEAAHARRLQELEELTR